MTAQPSDPVERAVSRVRYRSFRALRLFGTLFGVPQGLYHLSQVAGARSFRGPALVAIAAQLVAIALSWLVTERTHRLGVVVYIGLVGIMGSATLWSLGMTPGACLALALLCVLGQAFYGSRAGVLALVYVAAQLVAYGIWRHLGGHASSWPGAVEVATPIFVRYSLALLSLIGILVATVGAVVSGFEEATGELARSLARERAETAARQASELQIRSSEERLRAMAYIGTEGIMVHADGVILDANQAFAALAGREVGEVIGQKAFEAVQLTPSSLQAVREHIRSNSEDTYEVEVVRPDGSVLQAETSGRAIVYLGRPARVVSMRDISFRKGIEAERARLESSLRQAQKMESVGRLAGGVAHDFNNLLTVILSCAEQLKGDVNAGRPVSAELVHDILAAGERASSVTRQLLMFARRQVIKPIPLDLGALVLGAEKLLRRVLGEDVEIVVTSQPGLGTVLCDSGSMEQVILNLALNARDAMPKGGKLHIDTSNVQVDERFVALHPFMRAAPFVRVAIRDSGHGMSPEVKEHVFEPFFTTKPEGQGTGLGLATVYGIVKQSGGYILVDSELGRGTTFELYFPRVSRTPVEPSPPLAGAAAGGSETILVVEDDPQVREVTVRSLRAGGYAVLAAAAGPAALEMDPEELARARLLITDVVMPGLSGRALADKMRFRHPALRVLYVSGYTNDVLVQRGVLDSGIEFLQKPFTAAGLLARVRALLDAEPGEASGSLL